MKNTLLTSLTKMVIAAIVAAICTGNLHAQKPTNSNNDQTTIAQLQPSQQPVFKDAKADLLLIRNRIIADLMEPTINAAAISQMASTIKPDGSWPNINYVDTSRTGFQHREHLEHMLDLARAYKKPGTEHYQSAAVKQTVSAALDFWIKHDFICANWWWNEMGTPNWMVNTLLVLDTDLTPTQREGGIRIASRANFTGVGARAGGDFVPIAGMVCKQALFIKDEVMLANALKVMSDQIEITTDRGIKPDMGFHHRVDWVTSIHTYGTSYVSSFTYWTVKTAGTSFSLSEASVKLLVDYYLEGINRAMAFGKYPDPGARNRDLTRKVVSAPAGTDIPENFLLTTNYRKKELDDLVKVRKGQKVPDYTWNRYFWYSSYFTHQRKNYFASVRMHSSRQSNVEQPHNEEGLKMHHLADGANFLQRTGKEFTEIYAAMDWQKIPGTTVVQKPELPHFNQIAKKGKSDFVGAVSDGDYGAAAFDFSSVHDPLKARKAWFFFNDEYVCLGAGIQSTADYTVATTLNQCLLNGNVVAKTTSGQKTLSRGEHNLTGIQWIIHDSVAYLFNTPTTAYLKNTTNTGSYRQISHQDFATDDPVNKDLFTLWLNHGTKPEAAQYAYTVVPGTSPAAIGAYQQKKAMSILANTPQLQAVQHKGMQLTQVVFYQPGTVELNATTSLAAESPCIVLVKMKGNAIQPVSYTHLTLPTKRIV